MMETLKMILSIAAGALPFIITTLTYMIKFIKNKNAKKILNGVLSVTEQLQPLIVQAEKFTHYSGEEKKQYVLTRVRQFAMENNLRFDETAVSEEIDEIVATTKRVNAREKDKLMEAKAVTADSVTPAVPEVVNVL